MGGPKKINPANIKNKEFLKWMRGEPTYHKDNLVASDWNEKLEKNPMFVPTYAKTKPEMAWIMSMEYGRMWHKEKDEWFAQIFKPTVKKQDLKNRRNKLRMEFLEEKKKAEINIRERKERLAKEKEAKAKAAAEALEKAKKLRAKFEKPPPKKKTPAKQESETRSATGTNKREKEQPKSDAKETCPDGWKPVQLTIQCECGAQKEEPRKAENAAGANAAGANATDAAKKSEDRQEDQTNKVVEEHAKCNQECIQNQIEKVVQKQREEYFNEVVHQQHEDCKNHEIPESSDPEKP